MLLESEAQSFINTQNSDETKRAYMNDLRLWFATKLPLTVDGASKYKADLIAKYKVNGAVRRFNTVRVFYRWLAQRGLIEYSPFESVKAPKRQSGVVPDVPSDDDVDALLAAAKTEREAAVLSLLMNGLRASEVANLPEDSVKWTKEYGYYLIVTGKGNKTRIVPLLPDTIQRLQDFDRANGATSAWLVHNTDGGKLTYDMVNGIVDMAARKSKVDIHPHSLRHHYATRLIRAGANVFAVKDLLGHASVATTQQYVKMDITALVEATSLDPRNAGGIKLVPTRRIEPVREEVSWLAAS